MENAKWFGSIVLTVILGYFGLVCALVAVVGITSLSWNPGQYEMHPLVFMSYVIASIVLLYGSRLLFRFAKSGKWKWR